MNKLIAIILLLSVIPVEAKTQSLDEKLTELWGKANAQEVIKRCNKYAKNPKHCKIVHSFVGAAESTLGKNATNHNIYGNSKYKFKSDSEAHERFNKTYNKYYYKNLTPSDFYMSVGTGKTKYCTSEESSGTRNGCPNGAYTAWRIYNLLINLK